MLPPDFVAELWEVITDGSRHFVFFGRKKSLPCLLMELPPLKHLEGLLQHLGMQLLKFGIRPQVTYWALWRLVWEISCLWEPNRYLSGIGNALYCMSALFEDQHSNQNAIVAVGTRQCEVQEWSLQTNQRLHTYLGHSKEVQGYVLYPKLFELLGSLCGVESDALH